MGVHPNHILGYPKLGKRAAHVQLERHPTNFKKSKSEKVKRYTFRLFDFSIFRNSKRWETENGDMLGICWDTEYSIKRSYTCRDCTVGWPSLFQNHSSLKYWCFGVCHSVFLWLKKWWQFLLVVHHMWFFQCGVAGLVMQPSAPHSNDDFQSIVAGSFTVDITHLYKQLLFGWFIN